MLNKKVASTMLAGAMVAGLAIPAFAAEYDSTAGTANEITDPSKLTATTSVTSTVEVPTMKICVPKTGAIVANPYKLSVVVVEADSANSISEVSSDAQIINDASYIYNYSASKINVSATVTGKVGGAVKFATAAPTNKTTDKQAYIYMKAEGVSNDGVNKVNDASFSDTAYSKANDILLSTTAVTKTNWVVMEAAEENTTGGGYDKPAGMAFKFFGSLTEQPTTSWTAKDTVSATVAFTFSVATDVT